MTYAVRHFIEGDRPGCAAVLAGLPNWFGFAEVNAAWIAGLTPETAYVAHDGAAVTGFVAVEDRTADAAEIPILAVARPLHRRGTGRALVERAEALACARGRSLIYALTLGPSHPDEGYARTRAFWRAMDYRPLFETPALWRPEQPALIMVKTLRGEAGARSGMMHDDLPLRPL